MTHEPIKISLDDENRARLQGLSKAVGLPAESLARGFVLDGIRSNPPKRDEPDRDARKIWGEE